MTSTREYLDFATDIAFRAGRQALSHFQTGVEADRKADLSPITIADRGGEELLRRLIRERFPDHAVVGEEMGVSGDSRHRWILDPIDGTRSFVRGVPLFGVLVALEIEGEPVVGVCYLPALDEMVAAELASTAADVIQAAREVLSNVGRHAQATTCRLSLHREGESAVLEVDDDGRGFDPQTSRRGDGLTNLEERAEAMGGTTSIESAPDQGTTVRILIPI